MRSFSETVSTPAWRASAEAWVRERVARSGGQVVGDIAQPRVRAWSTQLVVPTDGGRLWFKANCSALAFEPGVHEVLARLDPGEVDEPFAVDPARGWILTRDRGATLVDSREATTDDWQDVVIVAAGMQRRLADHGPELLAAGLPDCAPQTVPARFAELTAALAALPAEHPSHLDDDSVRRLRRAQGLVEDSVSTLLAGPMPTASWQHGDLHPGNVFAVDGGLRVFDLGDSQWAHPLEILGVPWGWTRRLSTVPWPDIVAAYASVWADVVAPAEMERLLAAAMVTLAVNRSRTWWTCLDGATPAELEEWGDSPRYFLELVLEPFP
jgi:phosphotransferase family enzyme